MELAVAHTSGNYRTVLICPTSFDAWGDLTLNATYGSLGDITIDILDSDGATPMITNLPLVAGVGDLSGLSAAATSAGIYVRVNLTKSGSVAPSVSSLQLTWNPISLLLLDKSGPTTVLAGQTFNYSLRYSVKFVQAENLILWDELPTLANGRFYPRPAEDYNQDDSPIFVSATDSGQAGWDDAYFTVDFGFVTDANPTGITLAQSDVESRSKFVWLMPAVILTRITLAPPLLVTTIFFDLSIKSRLNRVQ